MDNRYGRYEIPLTFGLQIRVIVAGLIAGTARASIETPIEYVKVRQSILTKCYLIFFKLIIVLYRLIVKQDKAGN